MEIGAALLFVVPVTLIGLGLIAWLIFATVSGLRGNEPFESHPGAMLNRIKELEARVAHLEAQQGGR